MNLADLWNSLLSVIALMPHWLQATAVFALLIAGGLVLQGVVVKFAAGEAKQWHPTLRLLFLRTRPVARFALIVLAVAVALPLVPLARDTATATHKVLVASLILLMGWIALVLSDIAMERYAGRHRLDGEDNFTARKAVTQMRILGRATNVMIGTLTLGLALMNFDTVRHIGLSLFASAGVAGIVAGLAARPMLESLLAGVQLAITQPLRLGDVVVINGEWGSVDEIAATYIVMRLWDWRRQIVPLSYLFQNPFTNWTRSSSAIIGAVTIYADYTIPVDRIRAKAEEVVKASKLWDGRVFNLQVSDAKERTMELRVLVSAGDASRAWDLRCEVREKLIAYIQKEFPESLPRERAEVLGLPRTQAGDGEAIVTNNGSRKAAH